MTSNATCTNAALAISSSTSPTTGARCAAEYRPGYWCAQARYARAIAVMASPLARPTAARPSTPASSCLARNAMLRRSPSMPAMCLYSDGWRTPRCSASAARVRFARPTSSAIRSPSSTTRVSVSPALGIDTEIADERNHRFVGRLRLLRLGVVPGLRHDHGGPVQRRGDPVGLGLRIGKVGVGGAHDHQRPRLDLSEA